MKKVVPLFFCLLGAAFLNVALAQTGIPDPAPEIRRQELRQDLLRRELEANPAVRLGDSPQAKKSSLPAERPCRPITSVIVEGLAALVPVLLKSLDGDELNDSPVGRCVGVVGIGLLVDRVRNALIGQGFVTSRVEAPPQDLATGQLLLRVIVGRVAAIDEGASSAPAKNLAPLVSGEALNLRDIEQSLENLRRNPSVQADFQLRPGAQVDTTDVVLNYRQGRPIRVNFALDDSGNTATGKLMAQATLSWDSPLGLSDLVYFSTGRDVAHRQTGLRGNENQTFHYSVPWGYWLWAFTASDSEYRQTVVGAFQSYLYSGQTQSRDLQVSRVVHRDASSKTSLQLKGFSRRSNNFIDDTEVQVQRRSTAGWEAMV